MKSFQLINKNFEVIDNYDLFLLPNGIYKTKKISVSNYLYPIYYYKLKKNYYVSTSVFSLINFKKTFIRDHKFHTTNFYRPTYRTIDIEIKRGKPKFKKSIYNLKDKQKIIKTGAKLIQSYVTEIEKKYSGYVHLLLMGGKDSQNIILCNRKEKWIVLSGKPNDKLNYNFIKKNKIEIHDFIPAENKISKKFKIEEIIASDCSFDPSHFRWLDDIAKIKEKYQKIIIWMGTNGDGIFSLNNNHRDKDYFAIQYLHVATSQGILHQTYKNLFDTPVISPYQSPDFLNNLFYKFDPFFVKKYSDQRSELGNLIFGRNVFYPNKNPGPKPLDKKRKLSIGIYQNFLKKNKVICNEKRIISLFFGSLEKITVYCDKLSNKKRKGLSTFLFPLRLFISKFIPYFSIKRHEISKQEIL